MLLMPDGLWRSFSPSTISKESLHDCAGLDGITAGGPFRLIDQRSWGGQLVSRGRGLEFVE
ncbi:hypothetical protein MPRM_34910 [Mycobacterium parmense]|uniref:Uncharacterized protein n=1 Tax=Mycobacterium parmense TaxID=185642 RepID=A0A7I7YWM3_9MYCO|nr:hypothetical protein MPRM_34910 [Mycobacterium parmense]